MALYRGLLQGSLRGILGVQSLSHVKSRLFEGGIGYVGMDTSTI